jgi:hypothetical protein
MRGFVLNVLVVAVTAAGAAALICAFGRDPHMKELSCAAGAAIVSSCLALVPLILTRGASQLAMAQASLVATMIHLMTAATLAAVVILGHLPLGQSFTYWLLTFYWVTLIVVAVECARAVKLAPIAAKQS